jgi:hypothetical protein
MEAGTPGQGMHTCSSATVAFPGDAIPDGVGLLDPPGKSDKEVLQQGIKDLLAKSEDVPEPLMRELQSLISNLSDIFGESPQAGGANLNVPEHII